MCVCLFGWLWPSKCECSALTRSTHTLLWFRRRLARLRHGLLGAMTDLPARRIVSFPCSYPSPRSLTEPNTQTDKQTGRQADKQTHSNVHQRRGRQLGRQSEIVGLLLAYCFSTAVFRRRQAMHSCTLTSTSIAAPTLPPTFDWTKKRGREKQGERKTAIGNYQSSNPLLPLPPLKSPL